MREYFIVSNSFAAPIVSDTGHHFVSEETPQLALEKFADEYTHPSGLYAAVCYETAESYHKGGKALATWICNHEREKRRLTDGLGAYSYRGLAPGDFEVNGTRHRVKDYKKGAVLSQ